MDGKLEIKRENSVEDIVRKKVRTSKDSLGDYVPLSKA
jgi:hypothetical protein